MGIINKDKQVAKSDSEQQLLAEIVADLAADANVGQENMDQDDYIIPRISILQSTSRQLQRGKPEYDETVNLGEIYNSGIGEAYDGDKGIYIVPITYRRAYIEWTPISKGGGFVADHGMDSSVLDSCTKDDNGAYMTDDGNEIVTTSEYFIFIIDKDTGNYQPAVLSMTGSQLKKARRLNTMINNLQLTDPKSGELFTPAMFARVYHMSTVPESNDKGSWFGWDVKSDDIVFKIEGGAGVYNAAKDFREQVSNDQVKAAEHDRTGEASEKDDSPI